MDVYEVKVNNFWRKVDENIFRSWQGERRLNGEDYSGPVFYYLTNKIVKQPNKNMCIHRRV